MARQGSRIALYSLLLLFVLSLAACSGRNTNQYSNPEYAKYFTGYDGVRTTFVNFPQKLYYYGPDDNSGNEFTFGVETQNEGASFSRGGIYVSGFDPRMLVFREIPIEGLGGPACGVSIGNIGFGSIGLLGQCEGISFGTDIDRRHFFRADNLASVVSAVKKKYEGKYDLAWLDSDYFPAGVSFEKFGDYENVVIDWGASVANVEYFQHGRLFITAFAQFVDFSVNGGQEFWLAGDTYDWPGGEYAYFTYNGRIVDWPPGLDETDQKLLLTSCYQYTTFADPIVCIDPEPYSENRKVCQPTGRSYSGGNGAPVAITSITQENTPKRTIFHINVQNKGRGTVYDPGRLEKCSPYYGGRVTPEDINVIYLGDVRLGGMGLNTGDAGGITCSPARIRLDPIKQTGSTTCSVPLEFGNLKSAYQAPLTVELWYGYSEVQEKTIRIKRVI